MGLKEFQIVFDNPGATYNAGSSVSGQVVLKVDAPKKVRAIKVKIKGEANVEWKESESYNTGERSGTRTVYYTSHEQYFKNKFDVLSAEGGTTEIPPGTHTYKFMINLPPNLPPSFEGEYGNISYTVKATLDRPWKFDQECKATFKVVSPLDLNFSPEAKKPLRQQGEKLVGFCCWESGPLSVSISAPFSGYVSGRHIPLAVEVENMTDREVIFTNIVLRKIVIYKAKSPESKTKEVKVDIVTQRLGNLKARSWELYQQSILVPALQPSNLHNCSIIDLIYEIKVKTEVSGCFARGLKLKCPIIFGTTPITESLTAPPSVSPSVKVAQKTPSAFPPPFAPPLPSAIPPPSEPPPPFSHAPPSVPPVGWNIPVPELPSGSDYPLIPPPSYEESKLGTTKTIMDSQDKENT